MGHRQTFPAILAFLTVIAAAQPASADSRIFTARTHGFGAGDLYVFVFDLDGMLVASGGWPDHVGSVVAGPGIGGGGLYHRFRRTALTPPGRGWIHYNWYSPCTRSLQPKMTYVIRVGRHIVGVGAYKVPGV